MLPESEAWGVVWSQAPVYDILPPATGYVIADGHFFLGAQIAVSLHETSQIIPGVFSTTRWGVDHSGRRRVGFTMDLHICMQIAIE